jgi:Fibrobacter succinogenes major domain (Fib_succ_major).
MNANFGEFVDPRDNQVYKTIRITSIWTEDSVTFFAENLNYGKMIPAGTQQTDSTKYCYDDDPWYCENGFGGLYTWATAMNFPAVCDSFLTGSVECPDTVDLTKHSEPFLKGKVGYAFHQGICPEGWHIMDEGDWVDIIEGHGFILGANYLGSYIWGGSNERGFSLFAFRASLCSRSL